VTDPANGSTPWHQTSWPTLNETCAVLGIPVDVLRAALTENGVHAGPGDRLPYQLVADIAAQAHISREPLLPVGRVPRLRNG
jgi:hypothetical protein